MKHITTLETQPLVSLVEERMVHNEYTFAEIPDGKVPSWDKLVTESDFSAAIDAVYLDLTPRVFAIEKVAGGWEIISSSKFMASLFKFICDDEPYPDNGALEAFRGKTFKEISVAERRRFREKEISIRIFVTWSGNKGKEQSFRDTVSSLSSL